jgi:ABC-2 type transport system permease protein
MGSLQGALPFRVDWLVGLPPHSWVVTFLRHAARGEWWDVAGIAGALTSMMILMLGITWTLARRWYLPAWLDAGEFRNRRSGRRRTLRVSVMSFGRPLGLRPSLEVFLKRDFWMFIRDPMQRLHLLLMGVMLAGYLYSLVHADALWSKPGGYVISYLAILLFNGFLLASAALRFVFPSTSTEGRAFWCVRTAPISLAKLFGYKFLGSLGFMAAIGVVLATGMIWSFQAGFPLNTVAAVLTGAVIIGLTGMNLGAGAYFASRHEHNPLRVASSQGASITFLASLVYLGVSVIMVALPVYSSVGQRTLGRADNLGPFLLPLGAVVFFSLLAALAAVGLGLRSLRSAE